MTSSTRIPAKVATVLGTALALACASPALATDSGGVGYDDPGAGTGSTALRANPNAIVGNWLRFSGTSRPNARLEIQYLDTKTGNWLTATTAATDASGDYTARWRSSHAGVFKLRAVSAGTSEVRASSSDAVIRVTFYRRYKATWYGPGFYGHKTACGKTMSRTLMGVAHTSLPCGTRVAFFYKGHTITVPVVDRGPYGPGVSWDLTYAASQKLGFLATDHLGAVSLRG
ncbi:MAG: rare lipoprotein [Solirubrobacteraceae bacterium]|jgi:hypothetical protein|nr:rare lipoprotein [Solirubrobacteraceae bacterium]